MVSIIVLFNKNIGDCYLGEKIAELEMAFPLFSDDFQEIGENHYRYSIRCRELDVKAIYRRLKAIDENSLVLVDGVDIEL